MKLLIFYLKVSKMKEPGSKLKTQKIGFSPVLINFMITTYHLRILEHFHLKVFLKR